MPSRVTHDVGQFKIVRVHKANSKKETETFLHTSWLSVGDMQGTKFCYTRALLDTGSEINVLSSTIANKLSVPYERAKKPYRILGFIKGQDVISKWIVTVQVRNRFDIPVGPITFVVIQEAVWTIGIPQNQPMWLPILSADIADPEIIGDNETVEFHMILGNQELGSLVGDKTYQKGKFHIFDSKFGLIPSGRCPPINDQGPRSDKVPQTQAVPEDGHMSLEIAKLCSETKKPKVVENVSKYHKRWVLLTKLTPVEATTMEDEILNAIIAKQVQLDMLNFFDGGKDDISTEIYVENLTKTFTRGPNGRVHVTLPKRELMRNPLSKNVRTGTQRMSQLFKRFDKNPDLRTAYIEYIQDWIESDIITPTTIEELDKVPHWCVIPHHPVFKDESAHKIRVVLDGGASEIGYGPANQYLEVGPNILPTIQKIATKLRDSPFFIMVDIEKAFLQVGLNYPDNFLFAFRWFETIDGVDIPCWFRFKRMPWGITPAPFILNTVVRFLLEEWAKTLDEQGKHQEAEWVRQMSNTIYVDDVIAEGKTREEVVSKIRNSISALKTGEMKTTKIKSFPPELVQEVSPDIEPIKTTFKILGMEFHTQTNEIAVKPPPVDMLDKKSTVTRRHAAGIVAKRFDPMGYLTPHTTRGKILQQDGDRKNPKRGWDSKITEDEIRKWKKYLIEMNNLDWIRIPRNLPEGKVIKTSLIAFCDASGVAKAACLYEVSRYVDKVVVRLLRGVSSIHSAKDRNLMDKMIEGVKLSLKVNDEELNSGVLAGTLITFQCQNSEKIFHQKIIFTDSQVCCWRVWSQDPNPRAYVRRRVDLIRDVVDVNDYRHIPGIENPADMASRGVSDVDFTAKSDLWFNGPKWLKESEDNWPQWTKSMAMSQKPQEEISLFLVQKGTQNWLEEIKQEKQRFGFDSNTEAEMNLIAQTQSEYYGDLIQFCKGKLTDSKLKNDSKSILKQFDLRFDPERKILFSRSRNFYKISSDGEVEVKFQSNERQDVISEDPELVSKDLIILPPKGNITKSILTWIHEEATGHGSAVAMVKVLRTRFWMPNVWKLSDQVKKACKRCTRVMTKPFAQKEAPLPPDRFLAPTLDKQDPFRVVGIDFVGPFLPFKPIKGVRKPVGAVGNPKTKFWVMAVSCAMSRAIHLEVLTSLKFGPFECAFRRFTSRRRMPAVIISDNAPTFKAAAHALGINDFNEAKESTTKLQGKYPNIQWNFILARGPWWGGFYERMMALIKDKLAKTCETQCFISEEDFRTAIVVIERYINSRPLTTVRINDRDEFAPVTPLDLLQASPNLPICQAFDLPIKRIKTTGLTVEEFEKQRKQQHALWREMWRNFTVHYIDETRKYHSKRFFRSRANLLKEGELVLVKPPESFKSTTPLSQLTWPIAKVLKIHKTKRDGIVRGITIELRDEGGKTRRYKYPIQKFCPFEGLFKHEQQKLDKLLDITK